jgi:hypothetical protein
MPLLNTANTGFFDNMQTLPLNTLSPGTGTASGTTGTGHQHHHGGNTEARFSLPPDNASSFAHPRPQRSNPVTPANTANNSATSPQNTTNNTTDGHSPSQFFGGVDQLMREGQDWWLRDQSQLATGFDNWNLGGEDFGWLNATPQAVGGSPASVGMPAAAPGYNAASPGLDVGGGYNGGVPVGNGGGGANGGILNGINGLNGLNGIGYGGALNSYNEQDWYQ